MIIWAVNSSSKYLVSVSEVTWGLKGGLSCGRRRGGGWAGQTGPAPPPPPRELSPRTVSRGGNCRPPTAGLGGDCGEGGCPARNPSCKGRVRLRAVASAGDGRWCSLALQPTPPHTPPGSQAREERPLFFPPNFLTSLPGFINWEGDKGTWKRCAGDGPARPSCRGLPFDNQDGGTDIPGVLDPLGLLSGAPVWGALPPPGLGSSGSPSHHGNLQRGPRDGHPSQEHGHWLLRGNTAPHSDRGTSAATALGGTGVSRSVGAQASGGCGRVSGGHGGRGVTGRVGVHLLLVHVLPHDAGEEAVLHDLLGVLRAPSEPAGPGPVMHRPAPGWHTHQPPPGSEAGPPDSAARCGPDSAVSAGGTPRAGTQFSG